MRRPDDLSIESRTADKHTLMWRPSRHNRTPDRVRDVAKYAVDHGARRDVAIELLVPVELRPEVSDAYDQHKHAVLRGINNSDGHEIGGGCLGGLAGIVIGGGGAYLTAYFALGPEAGEAARSFGDTVASGAAGAVGAFVFGYLGFSIGAWSGEREDNRIDAARPDKKMPEVQVLGYRRKAKQTETRTRPASRPRPGSSGQSKQQ